MNIKEMTHEQKKIIGKITNLNLSVRLAWLEGIDDYMNITKQYAEKDFIVALYNYMSENGTENSTITDFCTEWKTGNGKI